MVSIRQFRKKIKPMFSILENMLEKMDSAIDDSVGFPYCYTGNMPTFLQFFSSCTFMEQLCSKILKMYTNVYIGSYMDLKQDSVIIEDPTLNKNSINTKYVSFNTLIEKNNISLIQELTRAELIKIGTKNYANVRSKENFQGFLDKCVIYLKNISLITFLML